MTTQEVEIKLPDLSRVALEPGDVLLARTPFAISEAEAALIKTRIRKYFPDHEVIVLAENMELTALRPVQPDPAGD